MKLSARTLLTVYLVLLVAVPSSVRISALGSLGSPSLLFGLGLLFWWFLWWLQHRPRSSAGSSAVRGWLLGFAVVCLVSFAAAMLRGQPADQVSPATTALLRLASWSGVLLVALDGIRTVDDLTAMVRRVALAGVALSCLGLVQFMVGRTLLEWVPQVPGISVEDSGVDTRGAFLRVSGTAIHPLEYGTVVVTALPLAIACAVHRGFRHGPRRLRLRWWLAGVLILMASLATVSRSAIVGLAVAVLASLAALPGHLRGIVALGAGVMVLLGFVAVPGMFGTLRTLFVGASGDPSAQSRTGALERLPDFITSSPWVGQGFGTFLPRYYIFDDAWLLLTVEVGVLGVACFALLVLIAARTAFRAAPAFGSPVVLGACRAVSASLGTGAVLFLFFDGLSFPMSAGLFFLLLGIAGATRRVAVIAPKGAHAVPVP